MRRAIAESPVMAAPAGGRGVVEGQATYESIITREQESFVWRVDDYPDLRSKWNFHPECEIHLIRNAFGTMFIGDYIGNFAPGNLVLVGSGLPHDWVSHLAPGERILRRDLVVQFHPRLISGASEFLPELNELVDLLNLGKRGLLFTGKTARDGAHLLEGLEDLTGIDRLLSLMSLLRMFAHSTEKQVLSSPEFEHVEDTDQMTKMQKATKFIHDHFAEEVRVSEVAELVGMTESTFSRFFQKNAGRSFTDFLRNLRIGRACRLLSETDRSITEICYEIGYANLSNFNRSFLKDLGMTPTEYRRAALTKRPRNDNTW